LADFCYHILSNALLATMLALFAWVMSTMVSRPAIKHLLWVTVLLRLVVPPLMEVDLTGTRAWFTDMAVSSSRSPAGIAYKSIGQSDVLLAIAKTIGEPTVFPRKDFGGGGIAENPSEAAGRTIVPLRIRFDNIAHRTSSAVAYCYQRTAGVLFLAWCLGTITCIAIYLRSVILFNRRVRRLAYRSQIWQMRTEKVAKRMQLATCPDFYLMRAGISPMLWGFGRQTKILFPERLLESLNRREQDTLLAHELAHYRRGDQWVRALELIATAFFWWHPVLWWARQEIERYEEECCDAWAVRIANGCRRTYADALLSAVDFVSTALPPTASGVSHLGFLRRRLKAIMVDRTSNRQNLLPDSYPGVIACAVLVLIPAPAFFRAAVPRKAAPIAATTTTAQSGKPANPDSHVADVDVTSTKGPMRLTVDNDHRTRFANPNTGVHVEFPVGEVSAASFSHDGQWLALGTNHGTVTIIDCETGLVTGEHDIANGSVMSVAISPDEHALAVGTRDGVCTLLDLNDKGRKLLSRRRRQASLRSSTFSQDGRFLAVVWRQKRSDLLEIWDLNSDRVTGSRTLPRKSDHDAIAAVVPEPPNRPGGTSHRTGWVLLHNSGELSLWDGTSTIRKSVDMTASAAQLRELRLESRPGGGQFIKSLLDRTEASISADSTP